MFKKTFLIFLMISVCLGIKLSGQTLSWFDRMGIMYIAGVDTDASGNIYYSGTFMGDITWGDSLLQYSNSSRFFVAKAKINGELEWFKASEAQPSTQFSLLGAKIRFAPDSSLYVGGMVAGRFDLNGQTISGFGIANYIIKFDLLGNLIWHRRIGNNLFQNRVNIEVDDQSNLYLAAHMYGGADLGNGFSVPPGNTTNFGIIMKFSSTGQTCWAHSAPSASGDDVKWDSEGNLFFLGNRNSASNDLFVLGTDTTYNVASSSFSGEEVFFIAKLDTAGVIDTILFAGNTRGGHVFGNRLLFSKEKTLLVKGWRRHTTSVGVPDTAFFLNQQWVMDTLLPRPQFVINIDSTWNINWQLEFSLEGEQADLIQGNDGNFYLGGNSSPLTIFPLVFPDTSFRYSNEDAYLLSFNPSGQYLWTLPLANIYLEQSVTLASLPDGRLVSCIRSNGPLDINGIPTYAPSGNNYGNQLIAVFYNDVNSAPNTASGTVFKDENSNCLLETPEPLYSGRMVQDLNSLYFALSDSIGNYVLPLDSGDVMLEIIPSPYPYLDNIVDCPPSGNHIFNLDTVGIDTLGIDFAIRDTDCPYLIVNINSNRRRYCDNSVTYLNYANIGNDTAFGVNVFVSLPENVNWISADYPSQLMSDSTYRFTIDTLLPQVHATITIQDSVSCNNVNILGRTQCTQAWITPSNTCITNGLNWDESEITVSGNCLGTDSIRFLIDINANNPLTDSISYRLFVDGFLAMSGKWWLNGLDSFVYIVPSSQNGLRLEVAQILNHPFEKWVAAMVDNCDGTMPNPVSSLSMFPLIDEVPHRAAECLPIIGSYDPNDKAAAPFGQAEPHFITPDTRIDYRVRFQNTGTDTAFRVLIIDTLDTNLDYQSILWENNSHPFTSYFTFVDQKAVMHAEFDPIVLPDSGTNSDESNGLLIYSLKPSNSVAAGDRIENTAEIYFDYNPPIITNTVWHTISDSLVRCEPSPAIAGRDTFLCDQNELRLNALNPILGNGVWRRITGEGAVLDSLSATGKLLGLSLGKNIWVWETSYCGKYSRDSITITLDTMLSEVRILQLGDTLIADIAANSYQWYWNDSLIPNISRIILPQNSGIYRVEAVSSYCGITVSEDYPFALSNLQDYLILPASIQFSPNPVRDLLYWKRETASAPPLSLEIVNIYGQVCKRVEIRTKDGQLDVSKLSPGVYFVRMNDSLSHRFIILP